MNRVLVLDAAWQPDRFVSFERALTLLWDGKAVAASDDIVAVMRSPSIAIDVPAVILLGQVARWAFTRDIPVCSRRAVLARDDHQCQFVVGDQPCHHVATSIDHLQPASRGGPNSWTNLVGACGVHNSAKADRTLEEMSRSHGWSLKRKPFEPRRSIRLLSRLPADAIRESWLPFLVAA
jgi:5-methylcytosine-specific restriction endonuclease McrA